MESSDRGRRVREVASLLTGWLALVFGSANAILWSEWEATMVLSGWTAGRMEGSLSKVSDQDTENRLSLGWAGDKLSGTWVNIHKVL